MKFREKYRVVIINLLISLAVSLVVNFSYFVFTLSAGPAAAAAGRGASAFPSPVLHLLLPFSWFVAVAFILLTIATANSRRQSNETSRFIVRLFYCVAVCTLFYFLTPGFSRDAEFRIQAFSHRMFNPMLLLKCSFTLIVAVLYGKIFELVYQKQHIAIENQVLKNENLQTRYNMLISQINPHFFFNSLNSLAMLVRGKHNERALTYIDRLSDTFRYIIQNGQQGLTTLREEIQFLEAYKYMLEIRYEGKLFFDIAVDDALQDWHLPSLSLQPLIENAVKHNSITRSRPFRISIRTEGGKLIVSNPVIPKIDPPSGTGIGLKNLASRCLLLTGQEMSAGGTEGVFSVEIPLTPPQP